MAERLGPDAIAAYDRVYAGEPVATDWSHALKTGYDLVSERWPEEAFDAAGMPTSVLPPVVRPGTLLGQLNRGPLRFESNKRQHIARQQTSFWRIIGQPKC